MAEKLKTYSLLINWCDGDHEQGNYAWTGRAKDEKDAEDKARRSMWENERPDELYPNEDEYALPGDKDPYGSVLECYEGALWDAKALEEVLRDILEADSPDARDAAYGRGRDLLAKIDGL